MESEPLASFLKEKPAPQLNQTIRAFIYDLVENKNFNLFVAAAIIFSVVMLQVEFGTYQTVTAKFGLWFEQFLSVYWYHWWYMIIGRCPLSIFSPPRLVKVLKAL